MQGELIEFSFVPNGAFYLCYGVGLVIVNCLPNNAPSSTGITDKASFIRLDFLLECFNGTLASPPLQSRHN